jgi:hypothetical protein
MRRKYDLSTACVALVAVAAGCPGTLEDPGRFYDAADDAGFVEDAQPGPDGQDCPSVPGMLGQTCTAASCHSASTKAQGLDLQSPDVAARLIGVAATEGPGLLIDPSAPSNSVLYAKVTAQPPFGARMPLGVAPLDSATIACVLAWVTALANGGGGVEDGALGDSGGADASAE